MRLTPALHEWLASRSKPVETALRQVAEEAMHRIILFRALADEAWIDNALLRAGDIAEEQAQRAADDATMDGDTARRRAVRRLAYLLVRSPNPLVRAAYRRLKLRRRLRRASDESAARIEEQLRRLRLKRPGLWRGGPRGALHPEVPVVRFPRLRRPSHR